MIRPFEHGGNIYRHTGDRPVLDYSANINPLGLAGGVRAAIAAHLDDVVHYPDPDCMALREALSLLMPSFPEMEPPSYCICTSTIFISTASVFPYRLSANTNGPPGLPGQK